MVCVLSSETSYLPLAPLFVSEGMQFGKVCSPTLTDPPPLPKIPSNPLPLHDQSIVFPLTHSQSDRQPGTQRERREREREEREREREREREERERDAPVAAGSSPVPGLPGSSNPSTPASELHEEVHQYGATQPGQRLQGQALAAKEGTDTGKGRPEAHSATRGN